MNAADFADLIVDLVHEVGLVKRAEGTEIYAPEREETLLRGLAAKPEARHATLAEMLAALERMRRRRASRGARVRRRDIR